jgi:hypothetical protein
VALFRAFSPADQEVALELLTVMTAPMGSSAHRRELHDELLAYFNAAPSLPAPVMTASPELLEIEAPQSLALETFTHPWLEPLEQCYSLDPVVLHAQLEGDYNLIFQAITVWERQRARGNGRLYGITDVGQLAPGTRLLDGHVHVLRPERPIELVVLGDLHGCYACLKVAPQSNFIGERSGTAGSANHRTSSWCARHLSRSRPVRFDGVLRVALSSWSRCPITSSCGNHELPGAGRRQIIPPESCRGGARDRGPRASRRIRPTVTCSSMPTSLLFDRVVRVAGSRDNTLAGPTATYPASMMPSSLRDDGRPVNRP